MIDSVSDPNKLNMYLNNGNKTLDLVDPDLLGEVSTDEVSTDRGEPSPPTFRPEPTLIVGLTDVHRKGPTTGVLTTEECTFKSRDSRLLRHILVFDVSENTIGTFSVSWWRRYEITKFVSVRTCLSSLLLTSRQRDPLHSVLKTGTKYRWRWH